MYLYFYISKIWNKILNKCLHIIFVLIATGFLAYLNLTDLQPYMMSFYIFVAIYLAVNILLIIYYLIIWFTKKEVTVHVHQNHYFNDLDKTYLMWDIDGEVSVAFADKTDLIAEFQIDDENDIPSGKFVEYNFYLPDAVEQSQLSYITERSYKDYSEIVLQTITTSPYDEDYYMKVLMSPLTHKFEIIGRL